jgi:hypothetical protein
MSASSLDSAADRMIIRLRPYESAILLAQEILLWQRPVALITIAF